MFIVWFIFFLGDRTGIILSSVCLQWRCSVHCG